MKILFITNKLPPLVDGVGDYTYNLAHEFAKHGHVVTVVCKDYDGIHTIYNDIEILPIVKTWNKQAIQPVVNAIKERQIEVVSLQYVPHGFHPRGLPFALIRLVEAIKKQNVRLFTFCHEVSVQPIKGDLKRALLSYMMRRITKQILKQSDYVATSIDFYKEMIKNVLVERKDIEIIPIASNIPNTLITNETKAVLRDRIAKLDEIIIAFFGERDFSSSLQAIKTLQKKGEKIKVLFIGKMRQSLKSQLPDSCYCTGILDVQNINPYFLVADIFVLPENNIYGCSFKSGSLAAALRSGLPVISAKGIMTSPLMINNENIIFTDFKDVMTLVDCFSVLIHDSNKRKTIGENAKKLLKKNTWENTYLSYMEIMK